MMRKTVAFIANSLDSAYKFQGVLSEVGVEVAAGSTAQAKKLLAPGADLDLVVFEACASAREHLEEIESLAASRGCSLLLIVDEESVADIQLSMRVPFDFVMRDAGSAECVARVKHLLGVTKKFFPDLQLWEGCEYFAAAGSFMNDYEKGGCGTMAGSNYVLAEFSQTTPADLMELRLRDITKAGFWAIIAHAERYDALKDDDFRLRVAGFCYIQINADSLVGEATNHSKELARKMLAEGSVSFVATDAHGAHYRKPILSEAAKYITEHFGEEYTETLLYHNPKAILDDVRI